MNKTLVVVPTYNERENLPPLAQRLLTLPVPVDVLVVDDNSPDGTGKLADDLAAAHPSIHVLHRTEKGGLGRAYIAGFKWALEHGYEFVFELDGDFSHNPDDIPMFLEAARNADLVLGSRYLNGIRIINWPLSRLMLSKSAAKYVQVITGMPITDPTGGYKCFSRRALQAINLEEINSNGYSFQIEMTHRLWRQGMRIVEVPIVFTERVQGHSKMSGHIIREALIMVWRLWFQNKMRRRPAVLPAQTRSSRMITLIVGTNRPGSNTRKVARHVEEIYAALKVPLHVLDLARMPPEIFSPTSYAEKPKSFQPFAEAVLRASGLHVVTPEYNGSVPGVLKYFIDMLQFPESFERRPVCFTGLGAGIWGALRPVEQLQAIFGYRNAYLFPERVFLPRINDLLDDAGRLKDPELLQRLKAQAEGFVDFVERLQKIKLRG